MSDLLTHFTAARLPALALRDVRLQALLVAGTFLPDVVAKGLYWVARAPEAFGSPAHSPVGLLALCYALAFLLPLPLRRPGFACLVAGGLLHVALDLLKENVGHGAARLFLPFDLRSVELGWLPMEDVVILLPLDVLLLLAAAWFERSRRRVS